MNLSIVRNVNTESWYDVVASNGAGARRLTSKQVDELLGKLEPGEVVVFDCRKA